MIAKTDIWPCDLPIQWTVLDLAGTLFLCLVLQPLWKGEVVVSINQIHKLFTMYINECLLYMENVILLTWKRQFSRLEVVICAHCKAKNVHPYKSGQSSILNLSALGIDEYSEYLYFGERWVLKSLSTMGIGEYPTLSSIQFCILDWD